MDQQPSSSNQPPQENLPPAMVEQPTQPVPSTSDSPKKSHKRAIIMAIAGLILILAALGGYLVYDQMNRAVDQTAETNQTDGPSSIDVTPADETTSIYVDGAAGENNLTEAEDTSDDIGDANDAAGTVGGGISENNL